MRRRLSFVAMIVTIAGIAVIVGMSRSVTTDDGAGSYAALPLNGSPAFEQEYKIAQGRNSAWVRDPVEVAVRLLAAISVECRSPSVDSTSTRGETAVVYMTSGCTGDDSVGSTRYRVELALRGTDWEISWVGWQHRCRRIGPLEYFSGYGGWHTKPCP